MTSMTLKKTPGRLTAALILIGIISLFFISGCGGSGGGSAPVPSGAQITVSGSVQAPNGQLASYQQERLLKKFADLVIAEAEAAISGMSPVPDGTSVELVRIDAAGTILKTLATTSVTNGRYSFNLTALKLNYTVDLLVRVVGSTTQMRAMVVGETVNIDPASEAAVRIIMDRIAKSQATLDAFTLDEISDIVASVHLLTITGPVTTGANLEATVQAIMAAVAGDAGITAFIVSAGGAGQTTIGPGDVGNYYPLTAGNVWNYRGTIASTGSSPTSFTNVAKITGTRNVNGVDTVIYSESNAGNSGPLDSYLLSDSSGVMEYGNNDPTDTLTPQIVPIRDLKFPFKENSVFVQIDRTGLDYGSDLDNDGKNEQLAITSTVTCTGFESVTVAAGTFANCAKIVTATTMTLTFSSDGSTATSAGTQTDWYAPGIGLVKTRSDFTSGPYTEAETTELTGCFVDGAITGQYQDSRAVNLRANYLIYDPVRKRIYASVPSNATSNPNTVTSIDPEAGTIVTSVAVGSGPRQLEMSDDGQFLYVSLDASNGTYQVSRVNLDTMTLDLTFSLGTETGPLARQYYVADMAVLPGNPHAVAISRRDISGNHLGIVIYDDKVPRPTTTDWLTTGYEIEFSQTSSMLYSFDSRSTAHTFYRVLVNASGVTVQDATPNALSYGNMKFAGGLIYTLSPILDPALSPPAEIGAFAPSAYDGYADFVPDLASRRMFYLKLQAYSGLNRIAAYDLDTRRPVGTADFPDTLGSPQYVSTLIRWGRYGLAFWTTNNIGTSGQVFLVRTPLVP
jgi:hypothetical protein